MAMAESTGKDPEAGKYWEQEEKVATENEMVRCHHQLSGYDLSKLWETVKDREAWCNRFGHDLTIEEPQQKACGIEAVLMVSNTQPSQSTL